MCEHFNKSPRCSPPFPNKKSCMKSWYVPKHEVISFPYQLKTEHTSVVKVVLFLFPSEKQEDIARVRGDLELKGYKLPPPKPKGSHFDSNCITPGTEFMANLAVCLQYYVHDRMNGNPAWKGIKVSPCVCVCVSI